MSLPQPYSPLEVSCVMCDDHRQHCHGTALVFDEYSHVCSDDPECTLSVDEHWFVSVEDD